MDREGLALLVRLVLAAGTGLLAACTGEGGVPVPGGVPADLAGAGQQTCASPELRSPEPFERMKIEVPEPSPRWTWATGITAADLDGDGLLDLLTPVQQGLQYYRGEAGGTFSALGGELFQHHDLSYASGTSVADYDGDGDLDVYVMRVVGYPAPDGGTYGENRLLRNDGGLFVDVTAEAGVAGCGPHHRTRVYSCFRTMSSSWGDYDGDGDLDLYVGNYGYVDTTNGSEQEQFDPAEPDFLYRNEGDGTFTDVSSAIPLEVHDGYTYAGGFLDLDGDLDLDLYTINDFGVRWPNRVMWNEGGELVYHPDEDSLLDLSMTGMGVGIGDFNGDGWMDLAIPEWNLNKLLESRADDGYWVDVAAATGFTVDEPRGQKVGWGTEVGDLDNDGDLDIVSQYGHIETGNQVWANPAVQPDGLYLNQGGPGGPTTFVDVGEAWRVADRTQTRGAVLADVNRDGWLDIGKRSLNDDNVLYLSRCGAEAWLEVKLEQPGTLNPDAVGARVEVEADGLRAVRWIVAGGTGFASSPPPEAHFGLGGAAVADRVRVTWPDGRWSEATDVPVRQLVTITRQP